MLAQRVVYSDANRICVISLKTKIKRDTCYIQEIFFFIFSSFFMKYTHKYSRHTSVLYDKTVLLFFFAIIHYNIKRYILDICTYTISCV